MAGRDTQTPQSQSSWVEKWVRSRRQGVGSPTPGLLLFTSSFTRMARAELAAGPSEAGEACEDHEEELMAGNSSQCSW